MPYTQSLALGLVHNRSSNYIGWDFPGPVVNNPPSDAVDADLIPGQGTKIPHAERQLSPGSTTGEKPT